MTMRQLMLFLRSLRSKTVTALTRVMAIKTWTSKRVDLRKLQIQTDG